jgi:hypothetical protein
MLNKLYLAVVLTALFASGASLGLAQNSEGPAEFDTSECIHRPDDMPLLFGGARPGSLVVNDTDLLSQPPLTPDTRPLVITEIPAGAVVVVTDLDEQTETYFRVIWPCAGRNFTGWVPIEDVRRSPRRVNAKFAPPGCARPLEWVDLIDDVWRSPVSTDIAVVVDLYRDERGRRIENTFYYLTQNGREVRDKDREIVTSGPFLVTGVVIGLDVRRGQAIGFSILPPPREDVNFFGIIYEVPEGCEFVD